MSRAERLDLVTDRNGGDIWVSADHSAIPTLPLMLADLPLTYFGDEGPYLRVADVLDWHKQEQPHRTGEERDLCEQWIARLEQILASHADGTMRIR